MLRDEALRSAASYNPVRNHRNFRRSVGKFKEFTSTIVWWGQKLDRRRRWREGREGFGVQTDI